jgi:Zn-dependent protease
VADILVSITVFALVVVVHEAAHALAARLLGDDTAKQAGRLTLNPLAHIDPVGSVLLPALLVISHSPVVFGWAKPVPINPLNFRNPRMGLLISSLAGPAANLALAFFFAVLFKMGIFAPQTPGWVFLLQGVVISLVLGFFNLIPIPPLDGSNMLLSVLPARMLRVYAILEKYGFIILIVLLYTGLLDRVIIPLVKITTKLLIG